MGHPVPSSYLLHTCIMYLLYMRAINTTYGGHLATLHVPTEDKIRIMNKAMHISDFSIGAKYKAAKAME